MEVKFSDCFKVSLEFELFVKVICSNLDSSNITSNLDIGKLQLIYNDKNSNLKLRDFQLNCIPKAYNTDMTDFRILYL